MAVALVGIAGAAIELIAVGLSDGGIYLLELLVLVQWLHYNAPMPTLTKTNDWAIRVNADEPHPLPHVHVGFRDGSRVSVCIASGLVLAGSVKPSSRLVPALEWIANNSAALLTEYRRLNP